MGLDIKIRASLLECTPYGDAGYIGAITEEYTGGGEWWRYETVECTAAGGCEIRPFRSYANDDADVVDQIHYDIACADQKIAVFGDTGTLDFSGHATGVIVYTATSYAEESTTDGIARVKRLVLQNMGRTDTE